MGFYLNKEIQYFIDLMSFSKRNTPNMAVISTRTIIFVAIQVCFITAHGLRSGEPASNANVKSFLKPSRSIRSNDENLLTSKCLDVRTEDIKVHNFTETANKDEIHISCTCPFQDAPPQWQLTNEEGLCMNATEDQIVNNSIIVDYHLHKNITLYCIQQNCVNKLIVNVPQIYIPVSQSVKDNDVALRQIRLFLPSASGRKISTNDMKEPILNDAEDIDSRSVSESDNYGGMETKYTFSRDGDVPLDTHHIDPTFDDEYEYEMEGDDPDAVQIHSYGARKDFYTLTMDTGN